MCEDVLHQRETLARIFVKSSWRLKRRKVLHCHSSHAIGVGEEVAAAWEELRGLVESGLSLDPSKRPTAEELVKWSEERDQRGYTEWLGYKILASESRPCSPLESTKTQISRSLPQNRQVYVTRKRF